MSGTSLSSILDDHCIVNWRITKESRTWDYFIINVRSEDGLIEGLEDGESDFFIPFNGTLRPWDRKI